MLSSVRPLQSLHVISMNFGVLQLNGLKNLGAMGVILISLQLASKYLVKFTISCVKQSGFTDMNL